jgi:hypothetical protein
LNTPGDSGPVQLERELLGVDVRQDVGQEAGVERDRRPSPSTSASIRPTWSPTSAFALTVIPGRRRARRRA